MNELGDRIARLEAASVKTEDRLLNLERDVRVLAMNGASKVDIAEVKAEVAAGKTEILVRVAEAEAKVRTEVAEATGKLRAESAEATAKLRTEIAQANSSLLMWVVTAIFLAQLLPTLLKQLGVG